MISCVGPSENLTFSVERHTANSSGLAFRSGLWIVSSPWSSATKGFAAGGSLVLIVLVSSHISATEDTVGVRSMKPNAVFGPSPILHFGIVDGMSYAQQILEPMTTGYEFFTPGAKC